MSRDVLIILLVFGLVANILLVAGVAWINYRAARRPAAPAADPGALVAEADTDSAPAGALDPTQEAPDWQRVQQAGAARATALPTASPIREPSRSPVARRTPRESAAPDGGDGAAGVRRNRRFVPPDEDGPHRRTDRATAAFLGEPVAPDPESRRGRRRHRARRPAGAPVPRTDLVLSLAGATPDARVMHALSAAMRSAVRGSDQVVELPGGRLRITLEADVSGGEAFVRRARNVVKPWLTALDPDLQLRVERPRTPATARAASPS